MSNSFLLGVMAVQLSLPQMKRWINDGTDVPGLITMYPR
jgi:hypothetical protein